MSTALRSVDGLGRRRLFLTILLAGAMGLDTSAASQWASFQNGGHTSVDKNVSRLADTIAWTAKIPGYGQSSPVIWDGRVYVTSVEGANKETCHVSAFDLATGKPLWRHDLKNATPQEFSDYVSKAAPTPAADSDGVVCFFEGGNLIALTHAGQVRWERNLVEEHGPITSRHGLSASVEQNAESVFVWVERAENPYILSVNKKTGQTAWKVDGLGTTSWASPRLVPVSGGEHLVLSGVGTLVGLDPKTGERLWKFDGITGNSTPTPMPIGEGRFLIGATVGRDAPSGGNSAESNGVVEISKGDDGQWRADFVWRAKRATSSFGSPIAHNGMAYFVNRSGVLYGLDLNTGEERFTQRLPGSTWATPLGVGSRVWFFGKDGEVTIMTPTDSKPELETWSQLPADAKPENPAAQAGPASGPAGGSVLYASAWTDQRVVLRRGDSLFAVDTAGGP